MENGKMENEIINWNGSIEDNDNFELLEEGEYNFKVKTLTKEVHPGSEKLTSCPMAILWIEVDEKIDIKHRLFLHKRTEGLLCQFFKAIGQKKTGEKFQMDWSQVQGSRGRCKVGTREYNRKTYNEIKWFLDPIVDDSDVPEDF